MNGGKLIGSGLSGCVYKPSLLCDGEGQHQRSDKDVSKLMTKEDAINELNKHNIIDKIDQDNLYHLPKPKICYDVKKPDFKNDNNFKQCRVWKNNNRDIKKLAFATYEDGGDSIKDFVYYSKKSLEGKENIDREQFFFSMFYDMENLFLGLKQFYINGYSHMDIKTNNIVVKEDKKSGNHRFNFIDFETFNKDYEISMESNSLQRVINGYYQWSSDIIFINPLVRELLKRGNIKYIESMILWKFNNNKQGKKRNEYIEDINIYTDLINMLPSLRDILKNIKSDDSDSEEIDTYEEADEKEEQIYYNIDHFNRDIISKLDVFSFGLVLLELWYKILNFKLNSKDLNMNGSEIFIYWDVLQDIQDLIMNMINPNFIKRITPVNIYEIYNNIRQKMVDKGIIEVE